MRSVKGLRSMARKSPDAAGWYDTAKDAMTLLCREKGWDFNTLCEVMALTSPRCAVTRNVRVACMYMEGMTLPKDVIRSTRLALKHWEETGKIRGKKTGAFAKALKGEADVVVLDKWMSLALGVPQRSLERKGVHHSAVRRVRHGARLEGMSPAGFQACVWASIVRANGRNVPSMAEEVMRHLEV